MLTILNITELWAIEHRKIFYLRPEQKRGIMILWHEMLIDGMKDGDTYSPLMDRETYLYVVKSLISLDPNNKISKIVT
jgi:hypothetical protein